MSNIKIDKIPGSRRFSNYWWATVVTVGSLVFFCVGLSSYFNKSHFFFIDIENLIFLPQGIVMGCYGILGIIVGCFLWYTIVLNIGSGYNEFNNENGIITIFRLGFPGKNRILKLEYNIQQIYSIKVKITEGFSPKREILLKTKDKREIPITKVGQPISLLELEAQASNLAQFLGVFVEGIEY